MTQAIAFTRGRIRTLDATDRVAEALLIVDGRIAAVGSAAKIRAAAPPDTAEIDLRGRTVLPGLIDAHAHLEISALADQWWVAVRGVQPPELLDRIGREAAARPAGSWIVIQGTFGQELPTREQIDAVAPAHLVVVRATLHKLVANSAALAAAGVDRSYIQRPGMRVLRAANGDITGEAEEAFDLFPVPVPNSRWLMTALRAQAISSWVKHGVTTIHELPASHAGIRAWRRLDEASMMPCRVVLNPILAPGHQAIIHDVGAIGDDGLLPEARGNWLRPGALKLFLDGSGPAAWTRSQLKDSPAHWGPSSYGYEELVGILAHCRQHRVQVWMHAVGSMAQELAMDAVAEVNRALGNGDHRTRIDHIGVSSPRAELVRLRELGVTPAPTPAFLHTWREGARANHFRYRTMVEGGLRPPGNSDSAGSQPWATNPWHGVHTMVTRADGKGGVMRPPSEALTLDQAIRTYTEYGAWSAFDDHDRGSLTVDRLGDLAVFEHDPFELPVDALPAVEADLTVVGGRVVYDRTTQVTQMDAVQATSITSQAS